MMHFWEELEDCKYEENEYLVDYLIEIVKDEKIDSLEDLQAYEDKYFTESNMSREDWVKWYEESFEHLSEIDEMINDDVALKVKQLRSELEVTNDIELKIKKNIHKLPFQNSFLASVTLANRPLYTNNHFVSYCKSSICGYNIRQRGARGKRRSK